MANVQQKLTNSSLANSNQIGTPVVIRFTADESEKIGKLGAYDSINQKLRIDQGKRHFWITSLDTPAHIIRKHTENV